MSLLERPTPSSLSTLDPTDLDPATLDPATLGARAPLAVDDVADAVRVAAAVLPPAPDLETFVASNPLAHWEDRPFAEAVDQAALTFGARTLPGADEVVAAIDCGRLRRSDLARVLAARGLVDGSGDPARDPLAAAGSSSVDLLVADLVALDPPTGRTGPVAGAAPVTVADRLDAADGGHRRLAIDEHVAGWCRAGLDEHATWRPPHVEHGLWVAWRGCTAGDHRLDPARRAAVGGLPADPAAAVAVLLGTLGVEADAAVDVLRSHLCALPGWAARIVARSGGPGTDLVDYVALRLAVEVLVVGDERPMVPPAVAETDDDRSARANRAVSALGLVPTVDVIDAAASVLRRLSTLDRDLVRLEAAEAAHRRRLLGALPATTPAPDADRPAVQLVSCIDPRSEGLRRHAEHLAGWETAGMAGFFALAVRLHRHGDALATDRCPVIVDAGVDAADPASGDVRSARARAVGDDLFHAAKEGTAAPLALAEVAGWGAAVRATGQTFAPGRLAGRARTATDACVELPAVDLDGRVDLAEGVLRTLGRRSGFARLVVLCGHGSDTRNNPYAAGLACGACGGRPGGDNARIAAALLNDPEVRRRLAERGIDLPADTWFLAAEHDTASDEVVLLTDGAVPGDHTADVAAAEAHLAAIGRALRAERAAALPGDRWWGTARGRDGARRRRGRDWAEAVPEWGLADNAAFVIGPRTLTAGADLGRRAFLHSYEAAADPEGTVLDAVLGGPLVVAHAINAQYFFSTVDPEVFGAGTKATHNVVPGWGVLAGPGGDLRLGLPLQSVAAGSHRAHQPLRLLVLVDAPTAHVEASLARVPSAARLVDGGWLTLLARPADGCGWSRRRTGGGWGSPDDLDPVPAHPEMPARSVLATDPTDHTDPTDPTHVANPQELSS